MRSNVMNASDSHAPRKVGGVASAASAVRAARMAGVVAMAKSEVGHAAVADLTHIAEHARLSVGLQRGVAGVERSDAG